jgi:hypothetical protein
MFACFGFIWPLVMLFREFTFLENQFIEDTEGWGSFPSFLKELIADCMD